MARFQYQALAAPLLALASVVVTVPAGTLTATGQAPSISGVTIADWSPRYPDQIGRRSRHATRPAALQLFPVVVDVPVMAWTGQGLYPATVQRHPRHLAPTITIPPVTPAATVRTPAAGTLTLTGQSPRLSLQVAVASRALTLTGQPVTLAGSGVTRAPAAGSLTLTGQGPRISLRVAVASRALSLTGQSVSLGSGGLGHTVRPAGLDQHATGTAGLDQHATGIAGIDDVR